MNSEELFKQGEDYFYGRNGVIADKKRAFESFFAAAEANNAFAACYVARYFEDGYNVVTISKPERRKYDQLAADNGCLTSKAILLKDSDDRELQKELFDGCISEAESGFVVAFEVIAESYSLARCVRCADNKTAVQWHTKAAEQGLPSAQSSLGYCYQHCLGVSRDDEEEVKWLSLAADQGCASAQYRLGLFYASSDIIQSIEWYTKAAEQGLEKAQYKLGVFYFKQRDDQSTEKAIYWLDKAAEQDNEYAKETLVYCYELRTCGKQAYNTAKKWFDEIAQHGSYSLRRTICRSYAEDGFYEKAAEWYAKSFECGHVFGLDHYPMNCIKRFVELSGKAIPKLNMAEGIGIDDDEYGLKICLEGERYVEASGLNSLSRLKEGARLGNPIAQYNLGICHKLDLHTSFECHNEGGIGDWAGGGYGCYAEYMDEQKEYAVALFEKAAEQGLAMAQNELGNCYCKGIGVETDIQKAMELYTKAADKGCAEAQYNLGICYWMENGVERSLEKAKEWYTRSAMNGFADAQFNLAVLCYNAENSETDRTMVFEWFSKAAAQEHAEAQYFMGQCYFYGYGVEKSYEKAVQWYTKAAQKNNIANAQFQLGVCYQNGYGVEQSDKIALQWYDKAGSNGISEAQYILGKYYFYHEDEIRNLENAEFWLRKAAKNRHLEAKKLYEENKVLFDEIKPKTRRYKQYDGKYKIRWLAAIACFVLLFIIFILFILLY